MGKPTAFFAAVLVALSTPAYAEQTGLEGAWVVDLSSDGTPYVKPMNLTLNEDGTVSGDFYESAIESGRWTTDRGRTCASFRTSDGVGPYHTSVCLGDGVAIGQTWTEHRNFLFNWNATRNAGGE